jgi:hypothetical protein
MDVIVFSGKKVTVMNWKYVEGSCFGLLYGAILLYIIILNAVLYNSIII